MTGVLYMLLGSASVGLSFVYAKKFLSDLDIPPVALTTYQIGLALLTLLLITDLDGVTGIAGDPKAMIGLVIGLGLLGTGVAYILYYFIVGQLGAITASSATYIPPVVALAIGWLLVNEPLDILDAAAVLLILTGVVVLRSRSPGQRLRPERAPDGATASRTWRPDRAKRPAGERSRGITARRRQTRRGSGGDRSRRVCGALLANDPSSGHLRRGRASPNRTAGRPWEVGRPAAATA